MLWFLAALPVGVLGYLLVAVSDDKVNQAQEDAEQAEYLRCWAQRKKNG